MNSIRSIWQSRLEDHIKESRSYLKYMLNDHLMIVLIFLFAGGATWYSGWLKTMPENFPSYLVMALLLALILSSSYVRTFLKEPDFVFLLPIEAKMEPYLKNAFRYSFVSQLFFLVAVSIIFIPLYIKVSGKPFSFLLFLLVQLLIYKWWNLAVEWRVTYFNDSTMIILDKIGRFAINFAGVYVVLRSLYVYSIIVYVIMAAVLIWFTARAKKKSFKWERHIANEIQRKQRFYRIANLFTDVPHLRKQAKRRKYMDWMLKLIPYEQNKTFQYMYARAFIRSNDYFGLAIRLTVISALIILYFSANQWITAGLIAFAVFLTGIQLTPLYGHFSQLSLPELYPVKKERKASSFFTLLKSILIIQAALLVLISLFKMQWAGSLAGMVASLLLIFGILPPYFSRRLKKMNG
ncbi:MULTISPECIES: ABC transporter permease [Bacillus]|uniref:EcsB n=2 Tax=Bacillus TaxID=1386 RepID=A0A0M3R910_9BACI|nr:MULTISPECIES: ABC transporter permease [Bacillus]ALC80622.1 ecsB [Bacillus gobiensis]MBP1083718.1 ABC-2 type transport system permease protein [Bacillus capparidis]MED1094906.1 ABC transporter permease [Bacillus capparidis]